MGIDERSQMMSCVDDEAAYQMMTGQRPPATTDTPQEQMSEAFTEMIEAIEEDRR